MRLPNGRLLQVPVLGTAVLLGACATVESPPPPSGFLGDYTDFRADPDDPSLLWWERDDFEWTNYRGLLIEPVTFYYHPDAREREINPEELGKLAGTFREAVVAEVGDAYVVVEEPGPGILRIRCAITDVVPVRPAVNVATSLAAFVALDIGGASIEVEMLDSVSGVRVAAGLDQKLGTRLDGFSGFTRLGQTRDAFREWARELRAALDTNP